MTEYATPSDMFAAIAAAIVDSEQLSPALVADRNAIGASLELDSEIEQQHWTRSFDTLQASPTFKALEGRIAPVSDADALTLLVKALQILDIWHLPLDPTQRVDLSDEHFEAQNRLHELGRYNLEPALGTVAPARVTGGVGEIGNLELAHIPFETVTEETPGALWPWLEYTTFLPPRIVGQHPDRMGRPGAARSINVLYKRLPLLTSSTATLPATPRIAIAPLMQMSGETRLVLTPDKRGYGFAPVYSKQRLRSIVRAAAESGAHILFLPEASVDENNLGHLAKCIGQETARTRLAGGERSPLAYVVAGIGSLHNGSNRGRNYLVLFNAEGTELLRQKKLSHWNIDATQQSILGLDLVYSDLADPIEEYCESGETIHIIDIDGLGRFANLICSDISQDSPGDWLILNARLDWLHAPILDKSICWVKSPPPWAVRRAERAAVAMRGRIAVTNSMALSDWVSNSNMQKKNSYGRFDKIAIGLLLDGTGPQLRQNVVFAKAGTTTPVLASLAWAPAIWTQFPDPPFPPVRK